MKNLHKCRIVLVPAVLLLSLSACVFSDTNGGRDNETPAIETPDDMAPGDEDEPESGSDSSLANTRWRLISYGQAGAEIPVIDGTEVTLQFQDGGQVVGSGGCNSFGTRYQVIDDKLLFTEITATKMACTAEGVTEQELEYFQALQSTGKFEVASGRLTIWFSDEGVLNFEQT